jgi:hypothetical protein
MNNNMAETRSLSVSPNVSSMIVPKREPIENDFIQNNKRRFGEHLSHDTDTTGLNKRQMATKKNQYSDNIQSRSINGRHGSNDEQQQKQTDSHLSSNSPKLNAQKLFSNGGNSDANTQSKPR